MDSAQGVLREVPAGSLGQFVSDVPEGLDEALHKPEYADELLRRELAHSRSFTLRLDIATMTEAGGEHHPAGGGPQ